MIKIKLAVKKKKKKKKNFPITFRLKENYFRITATFSICSPLFFSRNKSSRGVKQMETRGRYISNGLHLERIYARIFVRGHCLFGEANSFPRA